MGFELAPGTLLNNRYQVKKVLAFSEEGGVYVARDLKVTDKNWIVKEIIPPERLDEATLSARKELFLEAIQSVMQFDHPGLARILDHFTESRREYVVMEFAEGVTLQSLCDMTVNPLPEKQILGWTLQVCEALSYCHNRPKPFVFSALAPNHIILTSDEQIKLINYGLDRVFSAEEAPKIFSDSPTDIHQDFYRFGETVGFLLTKEKVGSSGLPSTANVSPDLSRVITRCLESESQVQYKSFDDLKKDLELVLHPPEAPRPAPSAPPRRSVSAAPSEFQEKVIEILAVILSQRKAYLVAEAVALVVVAVMLRYVIWGPPIPTYHKAHYGATGYVVTGDNELVTLSLDSKTWGKVIDRKPVGAVGDLLVDPNGKWLYISELSRKSIARWNLSDNLPANKGATIPVDRGPSRMVVDKANTVMFVVHDSSNNLSRVNLTRDPPQFEAVIATGRNPRALALSLDGKTLYVANYGEQTLSVLEAATGKNIANISLPGSPSALALTRDGFGLWIACQKPDTVLVLDTTSQPPQLGTPLESTGRGAVDMVFSSDGKKLYVANSESSNVAVFDAGTQKLLKSIVVPPRPQRLAFSPRGDRLWVTCQSLGAVVVIDPMKDSVVEELKLPSTPTGPTTTAP